MYAVDEKQNGTSYLSFWFAWRAWNQSESQFEEGHMLCFYYRVCILTNPFVSNSYNFNNRS